MIAKLLPGLSSRFPSVKSLSSTSGLGASIARSQSFSGFYALNELAMHRSHLAAPCRSPVGLRRVFSSAGKAAGASPACGPQPERVEELYASLKRGLGEYLDSYHSELSTLNAQLTGVKRNSRLGFCYDMEKQIKSAERHMRWLEFHVSKVDELFESYCIQRRLRDGASNMIAAFAASAPSRRARDSLAEVHRTYRHCSEVMCSVENELEAYLGEFHVTMKGLVGFARLCPGDHYEVTLRYGRQRWRLRGRVETEDRQTWDAADTVLLPLLSDLISIKVMELRRLVSHVLVGHVTCDPKELFRVTPQLMAVDINDLGTVKLKLHVKWTPFGRSESLPSRGGSTLRLGSSPRGTAAGSQHSGSPPDTPLGVGKPFFDGSELGADCSSVFSDSPGSPTPSTSSTPTPATPTSSSTPTLTPVPPPEPATSARLDSTTTTTSSSSSPPGHGPNRRGHGDSTGPLPAAAAAATRGCAPRPPVERSRGKVTAGDDGESKGGRGASPRHQEDTSCLKPVELDPAENAMSVTRQLVKKLSTVALGTWGARAAAAARGGVGAASASFGRKAPWAVEPRLEEAVQELSLALGGSAGGGGGLGAAAAATAAAGGGARDEGAAELQGLEQELQRLEDLLQERGRGSCSSSVHSLTVEKALGNFDFLHAEGALGGGGGGAGDTGDAAALLEGGLSLSDPDTGLGPSEEGSPVPMTTGDEALDGALMEHLHHCSALLARLERCRELRCPTDSLLLSLAAQAAVLARIADICLRKPASRPARAREALEESGCLEEDLEVWREASQDDGGGSGGVASSPFLVPSERLAERLSPRVAQWVETLHPPGTTDTVVHVLLASMLDVPQWDGAGRNNSCVTLFQFVGWLSRGAQGPGVCPSSVIKQHSLNLAQEVSLIEQLQSPQQPDLGPAGGSRHLGETWPGPKTSAPPSAWAVRALARALLDKRERVRHVAAETLREAGRGWARDKLVESCVQLMESEDSMDLDAASTALRCLQVLDCNSSLNALGQEEEMAGDEGDNAEPHDASPAADPAACSGHISNGDDDGDVLNDEDLSGSSLNGSPLHGTSL
ncbi:rho family-interacting cell polarization regulator 2-like [Lampetra fluviatilis]